MKPMQPLTNGKNCFDFGRFFDSAPSFIKTPLLYCTQEFGFTVHATW